jgi:hypothetical protein
MWGCLYENRVILRGCKGNGDEWSPKWLAATLFGIWQIEIEKGSSICMQVTRYHCSKLPVIAKNPIRQFENGTRTERKGVRQAIMISQTVLLHVTGVSR